MRKKIPHFVAADVVECLFFYVGDQQVFFSGHISGHNFTGRINDDRTPWKTKAVAVVTTLIARRHVNTVVESTRC